MTNFNLNDDDFFSTPVVRPKKEEKVEKSEAKKPEQKAKKTASKPNTVKENDTFDLIKTISSKEGTIKRLNVNVTEGERYAMKRLAFLDGEENVSDYIRKHIYKELEKLKKNDKETYDFLSKEVLMKYGK